MEKIWNIEFEKKGLKAIRKLPHDAQQRIINYLHQRIAPNENPRLYGKALSSKFSGLWRYRVGDYRVICRIEEEKLLIVVVTVGHRRHIYE